METVTCQLNIETTERGIKFGESWNFEIDGYVFERLDDDTVKVTFSYDAEVTKMEDDMMVHQTPSIWDDEYIAAEEKLQKILDVICLEKSGIGFRIIEDSQNFTHPTGSSSRGDRSHITEISILDDIKARYEHLRDNPDSDIVDAMRMHRLSANEENIGEKIGQLWAVAEKLYGSDIPKVLDTKSKRAEIKSLINQATLINDEEKKKLIDGVNFVNARSLPSIMSDKLTLSEGDGTAMTPEEVAEKLKYWRGARSPQAHGTYLIRNHDAEFISGEMEHIVETILSAEVHPSRYVIAVFKKDNVQDFFVDDKNINEDTGDSGYSSRPIHKFASMDMVELLRHNLKDTESEIYLLDYARVIRITLSDVADVAVSDLGEELSRYISERQARLQ